MKHIYYKNDFAVEITLLNASGEVVAPPDWQWHIEFTDGRRKYICSVDKGNAKVVGNTIMCYIDNHKFCCGEVGYKFVQAIPDLNYLDGFQNLITPKALPIELWEQESDNDVNIQSSVVPAYVVYDAYMTAKANGYTGTAEEYYNALNHIVDINKKEAERVEAEANRVTAEQQRVENFAAMESALTTATTKANTATTNATQATKQATTATKRANDISADLEAKREADYWRGAKGEKGDKGDRGEKGDQGERGLQGVQGVKGDDGVSPKVTTSKTGKVTTIEITDANGVHTATVNDGDSVEVVQSTGNSTTSVMSQKAVSDALSTKVGKTELDSYATKEYVQTNAPQETKESIEEKLGAWFEDDGGEAYGEVYTKAESDARYDRKNRYEYVCDQKQRLITIDRPFASILLRAFECGGYVWVCEAEKNKVARIDLITEEVKILNTPKRVNRQDKHCITQDEEGNFYWGPVTTSTNIYKCDADLNIIQSFPVGNLDGGWYFGGFLWNYSSNILKKMDLNGTTLKTFEIGTVSNNMIMQKIYGTQHGVFAGKFIWDNETDEIYTLEKSVSLSDTHLGGVTVDGWLVPELVTGYDASTHTFTIEPSANQSTTLGITNFTGRVDERCVVGNINCRDIAISFSKGHYVNTVNTPIPVPFNTPYYAMDGWMIWSENDKLKILNLLGEWK